MTKFEKALEIVLELEGGYSNHPKDPGGATNFGVTQATLNAYRAQLGLPLIDVKIVKPEEVKEIFRRMYWEPVRGDSLSPGLGLAVFDTAVHSGPGRAVRMLQELVGATPDGVFGPKTESLVRSHAAVHLTAAYLRLRYTYLMRLTRPGQPLEYARQGFVNRLIRLRKAIRERVDV